jgi:hypothetical protein
MIPVSGAVMAHSVACLAIERTMVFPAASVHQAVESTDINEWLAVSYNCGFPPCNSSIFFLSSLVLSICQLK